MMKRFMPPAFLLLLVVSGCHRSTPTAASQQAPAPSPSPSVAAPEPTPTTTELTLLPGPNAVPKDTRVVVNIPAFRLDVFQGGALIKSYLVGIGYPQFPVEKGLRKAESIIFNPTWTPPHSAWVTSMGATPGVAVRAGSRHNPLGPIKVPIGAATLIHGGKPLSKIGTFASHGCVGMTDAEVADFAKVLAQAANTELLDESMAVYLGKRTRTKVLSLNRIVPIELRYETIVVEDGQLHVYRDVYGRNTNTEQNLRAVLEAHGISFDNLADEEKAQALNVLNQMSRSPKKAGKAKPNASPSPISPTAIAAVEPRKIEISANQSEMVIDIAALHGKGYPAPVSLNKGSPPPKID